MPQIINDNPSIGALLGQGIGQGLSTGLQQLAEFKIKQMLAAQQGIANQQLLSALMGQQQPQNVQSQMLEASSQQPQGEGLGILQQAVQPEAIMNNLPPGAQNALGSMSPQDVLGIAKSLNTEKYREKQLANEKNKFNFSVNKQYIESVKKKAAQAKDDIVHLKRMKKVFEEGDVRDPRLSSLFNTFGLNYDALKNGDTTEIEKLQTRLLGGAQGMFGGRVTNLQTSLYAKGVPSVLNSKEAAMRLADQLIKSKEYEMAEGKTLNSMLSEDIPFDLQARVESKLEPIYEKYVNDYVNAPLNSQGNGQRFEALPDASKYDGKKIMDETTGNILVSYNGKWIPKDKVPKG